MKRVILLALFVLASSGISAQAAPQPVYKNYDAGIALTLAVPEGLCAYDYKHIYDAQMLASLSATNQVGDQVLMGFSDCKDLENMRAGRQSVTGTYGKIIIPLYLQGFQGNYSHTEVMKNITNYNSKRLNLSKVTPDEEIIQKLEGIKIRHMMPGNDQVLGITRSDAEHVSIASFQYRRLAKTQNTMPELTITTTALLSAPVAISFSHPGDTPEVLNALKTQSETYTAQLEHYNKKPMFVQISHKAWVLIGCFIGLLACGIYLLRQYRNRLQGRL